MNLKSGKTSVVKIIIVNLFATFTMNFLKKTILRLHQKLIKHIQVTPNLRLHNRNDRVKLRLNIYFEHCILYTARIRT